MKILGILFLLTVAAFAELRVGVAARDVTPNYPIRLNGFAARKTESDGVAGKVWAKAIAFADEKEGPALLITTDNLGVPLSIRTEIASRLAKAGVKPERITITATHTHSAPMLRGVANPIFGHDLSEAEWGAITRYTAEFTDALEAVALAAIADVKPAKVETVTGKVGFAINRRTAGGPVDHDLPLLVVRAPDGKVRAVWFSYACHCVTLSSSKIHGDWAGSAMEEIQRDYPEAIALASIGCGADQNPNSNVTGDKFDVAQKQGRQIADEVKRLLGGKSTAVTAAPVAKQANVALDFEQRTRAEWLALLKQGGQNGYYARLNLMRLDHGERLPASLEYPVQTWAFGDSLALVFLPGEVVVDYSLRLKREMKNLITVAYANDAPCYIPSERILKEGGYEGAGAMIYYDRPNRFAPGLEKKIVDAVHAQLPKFRAAPGTEGTQPKPPAEAKGAFKTKPGLEIELVASEPLVQSPVAIDWGADGRLWVCEMFDYPTGLDGNWKPGGRIKILSDSDGDGRYDKGTIFLDGLPFPTGVTAYRRGALICAAPDIIFAEDTDGDGKADKVEKLFSGFITDNYQARVNSLSLGLDGWFYGANGLRGGTITDGKNGPVTLGDRDFRFRVETREFEPAGGFTQQGRVRDDFGRWFGCENGTALWQFPLPDHYLARNPRAVAPASRVNLVPGDGRCFPIAQQLPRYNDGHTAGRYTAACGLGIYRDDALGEGFRGNAFVCEPAHNIVSRFALSGEGPVLASRRVDDERQSEFLASTDIWFRPVQARTGPDGGLYIVDMYRFLIEHPRWVPAERLAQIDTRAGADKGRIWRVVKAGTEKQKLPRDLTKLDATALVAALNSPNGTERDRVHMALVASTKTAPPQLAALARDAALPEVRVQALSVLDTLGGVSAEQLSAAVADKHPRVREQAIRLSERGALPKVVVPLADDADAGVRYQAALTLGGSSDPAAAGAVGRIAARDGSNPWFRTALLSGRHPVALPAPGGAPAKKTDEAEMKKLVAQVLAGATGGRAEALTKFAPALALEGVASRGGAVFSRACANCHRLDSAGHDVGPNLAALRDKPADYWLKNILDPNAVIEASAAGAIFEMKDGRSFAGIVKAETANGFTLAVPGGTTEVLARVDVKTRTPAPVSLMPEGLEAAMTPQEFADLLAFLRHAPKQIPGNAPALVVPQKDGVVFLAASSAELRGGDITFEPDFGNVGFWHGAGDHVAWTTNIAKPGEYDVWLDFSCDAGSAGNGFAVSAGTGEISGKIPSTGAWANYRREKMGRLKLDAGEQRVVIRFSNAPRGALMDLRTAVLAPAGTVPQWK